MVATVHPAKGYLNVIDVILAGLIVLMVLKRE